jgi:multiple sugar transport system substrate-binding protein
MLGTEFTRRRALLMAGSGLALAGSMPKWAQAADAAAITGNLEAWDWSDAPYVPGEQSQAEFYTKYFPGLHKDLKLKSTIFGYTDMLPKLTVAWRAGSTPDIVRCVTQWSPQFVAAGQCAELSEEELGIPFSDFIPAALMPCRKGGSGTGPLYGVPANNEVMFLLYNKDLFSKAGLDPEKPPQTWDELVSFSKTIHDKTGAYGYGMCAQQTNGNTGYRFMPLAWAMGGQIFDEQLDNPTWQKVGIAGDGMVKALSMYQQMFSVDKSVQPSALSDTENECQTLFLDGKVAMVIDHPSFPQTIKNLKPDMNLGGAMLPMGSVRRAVVLGGSNFHIRATTKNKAAAYALLRAYLAPYWNVRLGTGAGSEASTQSARNSEYVKAPENILPFNDLVFKMLPYGINTPLVPQSAQIWTVVLPHMIQEVLSGQATPKEAAATAEKTITQMIKA